MQNHCNLLQYGTNRLVSSAISQEENCQFAQETFVMFTSLILINFNKEDDCPILFFMYLIELRIRPWCLDDIVFV